MAFKGIQICLTHRWCFVEDLSKIEDDVSATIKEELMQRLWAAEAGSTRWWWSPRLGRLIGSYENPIAVRITEEIRRRFRERGQHAR